VTQGRQEEGEALIAFPSGVGLDELVFFAEASSCLPGAVCEWLVSIVELQRAESSSVDSGKRKAKQ
jgi:hypothetical protein